MQAQNKMLPGDKGWPLVGNLPNIIRKKLLFLEESHQKHGDIYHLDLGPLKAIVLNRPEHAQYILRDNSAGYRKGGGFWDTIRELLGNGIVVSEGDFWRRQRKMMQPEFHRQKIAALTQLMLDAIEESLALWKTDGTPIDVSQAFPAITMRVISRTMFGDGLSQEEIAHVSSGLEYVLNYIMRGVIGKSIPSWIPMPGQKKFIEKRDEIDAVLRRLISKGRELKAKGVKQNNLLSMLIELTDDDDTGMTDEQLRDEAIGIFLAGYETTSVALTWSTHLIMQYPDVMQKLQEEVSFLEGNLPKFEDIPKLTYAKQVLQESMRLYPPAWWLPRVAVKEDSIDGYKIPAGTTVIIPIYMIHRHPEFWSEPATFRPERFSVEQSAKQHTFAFLPFGAGPRICIGKDFAMLEGQLILARLFQRFGMKSANGRRVQPLLSTTLRPDNGVWIRSSARQPQ